MKKLIATLLTLFLISPAFAITSADEGKARVQVGPVKANVKNSSDLGRASISRSGDTIIIGCTYSKTVIKGINTRSAGIVLALSFDSVTGEFAEGETYDLSNSNPSALTSIVTAFRANARSTRGISTLDDELLDGEIPVVTGKMKVVKYDPETNEITANINLSVSPTVVTKGTTNKLSNKPQRIKMRINTIVE